MSCEGVGQMNPDRRVEAPPLTYVPRGIGPPAGPPNTFERSGSWRSVFEGFAVGVLVLAALWWLSGCASSKVTIYRPGTAEVAAEIEQSFTGRGCIAIDQRPTTGQLSIAIEQDGTSDWSVSRLLVYLGDVAGSVFGGERKSRTMEDAGIASGCAGLFE